MLARDCQIDQRLDSQFAVRLVLRPLCLEISHQGMNVDGYVVNI